MSGGRYGFASVSILFLSIIVACGGDREPRAPAGDTGQNPAAFDSATRGSRDTAASRAAARPDTAPTGGQPDTVAQAPRPKETPAPVKTATRKPAAPRQSPSTMEAPDTQKAAAPAEPAPTTPGPADATAPLRDAYHQAPLDTVTQQVYDGWKQYNLNCARCHGEDVQGTTIAPHLIVSLQPDGSIPTKELFMQTVCAGRPEKGMPAWCPLGLEMGKIEAIYSYVKGRSEGKLHVGRPALRQ
ncbi:MAG TPA: c-type cytochrome [Gemmatimonadales bacterium]